MFGVFEKRKNQQVKGDGESPGGFGFAKKNPEIIADIEQPEGGQTWETPDGSRLVIKGKKNSGRFEVTIEIIGSPEREQWMEPEVLTAMLASDGYKLTESLPVAAGSEMSVSETSQETMVIPVREEEVSPTIDNEDEYISLESETQEMIEKIEIISMAVGEILKKNIDIFGAEEYNHFLDQLDTFVALINELTEEDEKLNDTANEPGQKITTELLEKKKARHRELLDLYAELEKLYEEVKKLESAVKAEAEKTESLPKTDPVPSTTPLKENAQPLPEQGDRVLPNGVADFTAYQQKVASKPEEQPMDPPFEGGASATTETDNEQPVATAVKTESVPSGKKETPRVSVKDRREEEKKQKNQELFKRASAVLKEDQVFRKDGKLPLVIEKITIDGIEIRRKKDITDTGWFSERIRLSNLTNFLDYLKNTFDWIPKKEKLEKKKKRAIPKPEHKGRRARQGKEPADEDDAARTDLNQTREPDYEDARSSERIAAAAATKAEKGTDDTIRPESEKIVSGERMEEERTYEELENRLELIEADAIKGIIAKGLMIALDFSRENKMTKKDVIELLGGDEEVASGLSRAVIDALPSEWSEAEKKRFSSQLTKKRMAAFVAE